MIDEKRPFQLRISETSFDKIKQIALKEKRSVNGTIELLVDEYIRKYEREENEHQLDNQPPMLLKK